MGKIDNVELMAGVILNMRIDPAVFKNKDGIKRLAGLIRVFIDQRIYHVQFNIVSSDTLRAAQKEPEKYQDLLVKVAGYSAFFVTLMKPAQDAIIARTEHRL
jgi:formate C-acetyltransferase